MKLEKLKELPGFCILPWTHAHFFPSGEVHACCLSAAQGLGSLEQDSFSKIWNGDQYKKLRLQMLNGEKPDICKSCHSHEIHGLQSSRQHFNRMLESHFPRALRTEPDGFFEVMPLPYLDFRFSNICNFKCRTCDQNHSSSYWTEVPLSEGGGKPKIINLDELSNYPKELIEESLAMSEEIYFAGGEPLLSSQHYAALQHLIKTHNTQVRLRYSTNLSVLECSGLRVVELWRHFTNVHVIVSLDAFGERGEYARKGLKLTKLRKNFFELKQSVPHLWLGISITISVLNIESLAETLRTLIQEHWVDYGSIVLNLLQDPVEFSIQVLPEFEKEKVSHILRSYLDEIEKTSEASAISHSIEHILLFMNSKNQSALQSTLKTRLMKTDEFRKEDSLKFLPWLKKI